MLKTWPRAENIAAKKYLKFASSSLKTAYIPKLGSLFRRVVKVVYINTRDTIIALLNLTTD